MDDAGSGNLLDELTSVKAKKLCFELAKIVDFKMETTFDQRIVSCTLSVPFTKLVEKLVLSGSEQSFEKLPCRTCSNPLLLPADSHSGRIDAAHCCLFGGNGCS